MRCEAKLSRASETAVHGHVAAPRAPASPVLQHRGPGVRIFICTSCCTACTAMTCRSSFELVRETLQASTGGCSCSRKRATRTAPLPLVTTRAAPRGCGMRCSAGLRAGLSICAQQPLRRNCGFGAARACSRSGAQLHVPCPAPRRRSSPFRCRQHVRNPRCSLRGTDHRRRRRLQCRWSARRPVELHGTTPHLLEPHMRAFVALAKHRQAFRYWTQRLHHRSERLDGSRPSSVCRA